MSVALAFILLAEAATACAPAAPPLLPGGASVVRPVAKPEPAPFERLGPAAPLPKAEALRPAAVDVEAGGPGGEPPAEQCVPVPLDIA
jgi:hypothetical protein